MGSVLEPHIGMNFIIKSDKIMPTIYHNISKNNKMIILNGNIEYHWNSKRRREIKITDTNDLKLFNVKEHAMLWKWYVSKVV